jgi:hypothetical protein
VKCKDTVDARRLCAGLLGGHEDSDPYELNGEKLRTLTGRCLQLDMSNQDDREVYANLAAKCRSCDGSVELIWEEHVSTNTGGLMVYVCYTETSLIPSKFINK